ncbi:uncharacterized protein PV09_07838 [Verruconis gallopava]|uniref:RNase H type-1 domain-containing protein n=1 Tax=Verruconis gallopava TaxID=253628 RepID=A0A0D2A2P7_9PEZI|nr:uncharacterized protein PV09_07838 [Verruconis gallopava]KIW00645.1 hypothetical protein PV09_07838 [Verruconis gallopava]
MAEALSSCDEAVSVSPDGAVRHELAGIGIHSLPSFGLRISNIIYRGPKPDAVKIQLEVIHTALQAIVRNPEFSTRKTETLRNIYELLQLAIAHQLTVEFMSVPPHASLQVNEFADDLAHVATRKERTPIDRSVTAQEFRNLGQQRIEYKKARFQARTVAKHLRDLDKALPGPRTRTICDRLVHVYEVILAETRGGYCGLRDYLHKTGQAENDSFECGQIETVEDCLPECQKWPTQQ